MDGELHWASIEAEQGAQRNELGYINEEHVTDGHDMSGDPPSATPPPPLIHTYGNGSIRTSRLLTVSEVDS
jgi:hypothetical protein